MLLLTVLLIYQRVIVSELQTENRKLEKERGELLYEATRLEELTMLKLADLSVLEEHVRDILEGKNGETDSVETVTSGVSRTPEYSSIFNLPVVWPLKTGWVTREYDASKAHTGIDIAAAAGDEVLSTGDGVVKRVLEDNILGKMVVLGHWAGMETSYAHNSEILVNEGDFVSKGQVIAKVGSTGRSSAPHLHYEVRIYGQPIDPRIHLDRE